MAKNQHGTSGLPVRAPLAVKIERYHRIRKALQPKEEGGDGRSVQEVADYEGISRQRVRQIADGPEPRKPGRPWDRR